MYKIKCLIDGEIFEHELKGKEKWMLRNYIKRRYNISYEEYILKFFHKNIHPECACGCKNLVKFHKGKFLKYYKDHKNKIGNDIKSIEKAREKIKLYNSLEKRLERLGTTKEKIKEYYEKYINFKIDYETIKKETGIDIRTFKKYCIEFNFIENIESFKRITKKHQFFWSDKNNKIGGRKNIEEETLVNIKYFLEKNKNKYTLKEIINKFELDYTPLVLQKRLIESFGKEYIENLLKLGISSKSEVEYYNILKFFFGEEIKKDFKLEGKRYDYILNDKILIEFDGDYWHSLLRNIKRDKEKDKIAIRNGYKIFRIKESESKNIEILIKLKKISYENKSSKD